MTALIRRLRVTHLRAFSVALLATAFSAGLAFADEAAGPASAAAPGLAIAELASGQTVPVAGQDETTEPEEEELEEELEELEEVEEVEETDEDGGENCATDPTTLTEEELAEMRHGSIVCWAANQETPDGYDNHGQWVSEWAKSKAGFGGNDDGEDEESEVEASSASGGPGAAAREFAKSKGRGGRP